MSDLPLIKRLLANRVEEVCRHLFPSGELKGHEFCVGNLSGDPGDSLKINCNGKPGIGQDFATGQKFNNLLDIWNHVRGHGGKLSAETVREAEAFLGIRSETPAAVQGPWLGKDDRSLQEGSQVGRYLVEKRKITLETLAAYGVMQGYLRDDSRILPAYVLPSYTADGKLEYVKRIALERRPDGKKIVQTNKSPQWALWGKPLAGVGDAVLTIAEGEIDAMSWFQTGIPAVSVPNGTTFGGWFKRERDFLDGFQRILVAFDSDGAGRDGAEALAREIGIERAFIVEIKGYKDANEALVAGDLEALRAAHRTARRLDPSMADDEQEGPSPKTKEEREKDQRQEALREKLAKRRYDHQTPKPKPDPVLWLGDSPICTPGNLTNLQAGIKAGKTATVCAILGAAMSEDGEAASNLGFAADNKSRKAVVHFDTEQTPHDHDQGVRRALRRAGIGEQPEWFESYCLTDCETWERLEMLRLVLSDAAARHGGIYLVLIDGVADLCRNPNDPEESFDLVDELVRLAILHGAAVITVLHENPSSDPKTPKTRGHLGSQLERKAETNLRIAKDAEGITTVWTDRSRHCHLTKDQGVCFQWDGDLQAHALCPDAADRVRGRKIEAERPKVEAVWHGLRADEFLTYTEVTARICQVHGKAEPTAKKWVASWTKLGLLYKNGSLYQMIQ